MAKDLLKLQRAPELNLRTLLRPAVFVPETQGPERAAARLPHQPQPPGDRDRRVRQHRRADHDRGRAGRDRRRDRGRVRRARTARPASTRWPTAASAWPATPTIAAVNEAFGTDLPDDDFDTIGGLVAHELGRVPRRGEAVDVGGLRFAVMLTRGGAVRWFKVTRAPEAGDAGGRRRLTPAAAAARGRGRCAASTLLPRAAARRAAQPAVRRTPRPGRCSSLVRRGCWPGASARRHAAARRRARAGCSAPPGSPPAPGGCSSACTATAACRRCWRRWRCWLLCGVPVALPGGRRWPPSRAGAAAGRWRDALLFAALLAAGRTGARRASSPAFRGSPPATRTSTRRWRRWRRGSASTASARRRRRWRRWLALGVRTARGRARLAPALRRWSALLRRWRCRPGRLHAAGRHAAA